MYRSTFKSIFTSLSVATLLILGACNIADIETDIEIPNITGDWVARLGSATYTVAELIEDLEDQNLDIDTAQSGLLSIVYRDSSEFNNIHEIVQLEDQVDNGIVDSPIEIIDSPTAVDVPFTQNLEFLSPISDDEELDSLIFDSGTISIDFESTFSVDMDFTMTIDDIIDTETGEPIVFSGAVPAGGSGSDLEALSGNRTFAKKNNSNQNVYTGTFNAILHIPIGGDVSSSDSFRYMINIKDADFKTIYGYFGSKEIDVHQQTIDFDFFDELDGSISFGNPEIRLILDNAFGVTLGLDLNEVYAINSEGQKLNLNGTITDELAFINAPNINSVGTSKISVVTVNNENSNIIEMLELSPNQFSLNFTGETNYSNISSINPKEDRNFIDQSSTISTIIEVEIPLILKLAGLINEFDFNIGDVDLQDSDTIGIRLKSLNRMPITGSFNMQFLDTDSLVLYEIKEVLAFQSPEISSSGIIGVDNAQENVSLIQLHSESLEAFEMAPIMRIEMTIDSYNATNGEYVQVLDNYDIELIVGIESYTNIKL